MRPLAPGLLFFSCYGSWSVHVYSPSKQLPGSRRGKNVLISFSFLTVTCWPFRRNELAQVCALGESWALERLRAQAARLRYPPPLECPPLPSPGNWQTHKRGVTAKQSLRRHAAATAQDPRRSCAERWEPLELKAHSGRPRGNSHFHFNSARPFPFPWNMSHLQCNTLDYWRKQCVLSFRGWGAWGGAREKHGGQ